MKLRKLLWTPLQIQEVKIDIVQLKKNKCKKITNIFNCNDLQI